MDFELTIRCGEKSFGGSITIKDWSDAVDLSVAEIALKQSLDIMYNKAVSNLVKEVVGNKGDKND